MVYDGTKGREGALKENQIPQHGMIRQEGGREDTGKGEVQLLGAGDRAHLQPEGDSVGEILRLLAEYYPEAKTALRYDTPFQLLVATILSAQCTDRRVNNITAGLFKRFPDAFSLAKLEPAELEQHIKGCGLFRAKSKYIIATSRILVEKYGGRVPDRMEELVELPGVGRKTANVVLANAFGIPAMAVDTHVQRVSRRLGLSRGENPKVTEREICQVIPRSMWILAHHWLIAHGRQVCHARRPACVVCPLAGVCPSRRLETV